MNIVRVSKEDCQEGALAHLDQLILLRELPNEWALAARIGDWLFLLGLADQPSTEDLVDMTPVGLREIRKRVEEA